MKITIEFDLNELKKIGKTVNEIMNEQAELISAILRRLLTDAIITKTFKLPEETKNET